jgi:hypothetical protein
MWEAFGRILGNRLTLPGAIIALIVVLNLWLDYYHRGWLIIDAIIVR